MPNTMHFVTATSLTFLCFLALTEAVANCPNNWLFSQESSTCVRLYTDGLPWADARTACQTQGGDLVNIVNPTMNSFIADGVVKDYPAWMGLSDQTVEGTWVWLDNDAPANYLNWYAGDPDGGTSQNCALMKYNNEWIDSYCSMPYSYVCEIPATFTIGSCEADWAYSNQTDTCVRLYTDGLPWEEARLACQLLEGGDLVKIANPAMNDFVAGDVVGDYSAWIGLNDLMVTEDLWVWLDETSEAGYINWYTGEPDGGSSQNCALLKYDDAWIDSYCSLAYPYVCEVPATSYTVSCPEQWMYSEESNTCVQFIMMPLSWDDARVTCQSQGGDLLVVVNPDMNTFIADFVSGPNTAWIGLNDLAQENFWVWLDDADTEAKYIDWYPGEPDGGASQNCGVIQYNDHWIDSYCSLQYPFICEIPSNLTSGVVPILPETTAKSPAATTKEGPKPTEKPATSAPEIPPEATTAAAAAAPGAGDDPSVDNDDDSTSGGLSGGAVAGIVIAVLVVLLIPAALYYRRIVERRRGQEELLDFDNVNFVSNEEDVSEDLSMHPAL